MTTHTIELTDPFDASHPLIIPLQLNGVTSYFDVYSPCIEECENENIPKIHLTVEEPPWDVRKSPIRKYYPVPELNWRTITYHHFLWVFLIL